MWQRKSSYIICSREMEGFERQLQAHSMVAATFTFSAWLVGMNTSLHNLLRFIMCKCIYPQVGKFRITCYNVNRSRQLTCYKDLISSKLISHWQWAHLILLRWSISSNKEKVLSLCKICFNILNIFKINFVVMVLYIAWAVFYCWQYSMFCNGINTCDFRHWDDRAYLWIIPSV